MKATPQHQAAFRALVHEAFPSMPRLEIKRLTERHFAEMNQPNRRTHCHAGTEFITCLVAAHVRHTHTDYESRVNAPLLGYRVPELKQCARNSVQDIINQYLNTWRQLP